MASPAEWCDGDPELLAHARTEGLRDARVAVAQRNQDALEMLELVARSP